MTTAYRPPPWRARIAALRMGLWKLGTLPYNTLIFIAAAVVLVQARVWKIRAT